VHSFHSTAYKIFCARLRQARLERGLTQVAVGIALGIPHTRVSRMEQGERRVDVVELAAIAKLYRKPLAWFVPGA
jgi:transcriptional regulator with XRE-family HTH domain